MIKIALPSNGKNLLAPLANTFERCCHFIIVNIYQNKSVAILLNDAQVAARGAEVQAAQILVDEDINVLITPKINIEALKILLNAGIKIYIGVIGTLQENIDAYKKHRLIETRIAIELDYPEFWFALSQT